jgi:hypothetical protein
MLPDNRQKCTVVLTKYIFLRMSIECQNERGNCGDNESVEVQCAWAAPVKLALLHQLVGLVKEGLGDGPHPG